MIFLCLKGCESTPGAYFPLSQDCLRGIHRWFWGPMTLLWRHCNQNINRHLNSQNVPHILPLQTNCGINIWYVFWSNWTDLLILKRETLIIMSFSQEGHNSKEKRSILLTHWGRVTQIYVSKLTNIGFRKWLGAWTAPSHYLNQWWNIVNWTLTNKLQWIFNRNSYIFIQKDALENVVSEMASILSQPHCVKDILRHCFDTP